MGGGTTTIVAPSVDQSLTPEEKRLIAQQTQLANFQLKELKKQAAHQDILFKALPGQLAEEEQFQKRQRSLQEQRDILSIKSLEQAQELLPFQKAIAEKELEALERGGRVDDETAALIDELAAEQQTIGLSNIDARTGQLIEQVTQQTAAGKGLRSTDTPIADRLDIIGEQAVQERAGLIGQLQADAASAKFSIPLAQGQLTTQRGGALAGLGATAADFQANLQQQANANRSNNITNIGNLGLGLASTNARPGDTGLGLQSSRIAQGGITQRTREDFNADVAAGLIGATGGALEAGDQLFFDRRE